jgi:hypothetical protein
VPFVIAPAILTVPIPADPPSAMPFVHLQITPTDAFVFAPPVGPSTLITLRHNNAPPPPDADIILAPYVIPAPSKPVNHPDQPKTVVPSLITQIPEPAPMTLLAIGLSAIVWLRRKRGFLVPSPVVRRG